MNAPIAFHNGSLIPAAELTIPVSDAGFVMGVTVSEQMRTFGGKLFRLSEHLERFFNSLAIVGVALPFSQQELASAAERLVKENYALLDARNDLGLSLFATPGAYATMAPADERGPTVAMHTYPVAFGTFAEKYSTGQRMVTSSVPQIPAASLPRELKCRSRMHYFLADRDAASRDPAARALMLDTDGCVLEATTANVLMYREGEGLISPPAERILPGISVAATLEVAAKLNIPHTQRTFTVEEFGAADEAFLTSTSVCILPIISLDGRAIGQGLPGSVFQQLLSGWHQLTGVDPAEQAKQFAGTAVS